MQFRSMNISGWEVSVLGFGCMRLPTLDAWNRIDYKKASEMLSYAIDRGVNYLDTAWTYHNGASEEFLGHFLESGYRSKVKVATKAPMWLIDSTKDFLDCFERQRTRLRVETVDFYLFHALNRNR